MTVALRAKSYPCIGFYPEIAGGKPVIDGTRITVRCIAGYYQMGMAVDEILNTLPDLTPSQVHSASAYYFDYQEEIDADLTESSDEDVHSGLAHAMRKRGYDIVHAQESDRKGRSESEQLAFAVQQQRSLFSFNVKDFVLLHNQHVQSQQEH